MAYDADGRRVEKEDSGGITKFIWDRENVLVERNALDVAQAVYTLEPVIFGSLISQYRAALTSLFHFDALGCTDSLTSSSGITTDNYHYKAFGPLVTSVGNTENNFRFFGLIGSYLDGETISISSRHYQPNLGRYLSRASAYALMDNNPTATSGLIWTNQESGTTLDVESEGPLSSGPCGGFTKLICWKVRTNDPDRTNGYVIQRVQVTFERCNCADECYFEQFTYWEAWRVSRGKVMHCLRKPPLGQQVNCDVFKWPLYSRRFGAVLSLVCTYGYVSIMGCARFYQDVLPSAFPRDRRGAPPAGPYLCSVLADDARPRFTAGSWRGQSIQHSVIGIWDCCGGCECEEVQNEKDDILFFPSSCTVD
jgi:hypothetical protein